MGSHGGATPEGQIEVLASYGITETAMSVPIRASLEVRQIGTIAEGDPSFAASKRCARTASCSSTASSRTPISSATLGSGLVKMSVIGLGKRDGAATMHLRRQPARI